MIAGRLKSKLCLLKPLKETDEMGSEKTTYFAARTVWTERVNMNGSRSEEVGEHFPDYEARFNIRSPHEVQENWRVKEMQTGHIYTVTAIVPNVDRGYKSLICDRVNE